MILLYSYYEYMLQCLLLLLTLCTGFIFIKSASYIIFCGVILTWLNTMGSARIVNLFEGVLFLFREYWRPVVL